MDLTCALMLTMVSLTQEIESPLGHSKALDTTDGFSPGPDTDKMVASMAAHIELMERKESEIDHPSKKDVYIALRKMAAQTDIPMMGAQGNGEAK